MVAQSEKLEDLLKNNVFGSKIFREESQKIMAISNPFFSDESIAVSLERWESYCNLMNEFFKEEGSLFILGGIISPTRFFYSKKNVKTLEQEKVPENLEEMFPDMKVFEQKLHYKIERLKKYIEKIPKKVNTYYILTDSDNKTIEDLTNFYVDFFTQRVTLIKKNLDKFQNIYAKWDEIDNEFQQRIELQRAISKKLGGNRSGLTKTRNEETKKRLEKKIRNLEKELEKGEKTLENLEDKKQNYYNKIKQSLEYVNKCNEDLKNKNLYFMNEKLTDIINSFNEISPDSDSLLSELNKVDLKISDYLNNLERKITFNEWNKSTRITKRDLPNDIICEINKTAKTEYHSLLEETGINIVTPEVEKELSEKLIDVSYTPTKLSKANVKMFRQGLAIEKMNREIKERIFLVGNDYCFRAQSFIINKDGDFVYEITVGPFFDVKKAKKLAKKGIKTDATKLANFYEPVQGVALIDYEPRTTARFCFLQDHELETLLHHLRSEDKENLLCIAHVSDQHNTKRNSRRDLILATELFLKEDMSIEKLIETGDLTQGVGNFSGEQLAGVNMCLEDQVFVAAKSLFNMSLPIIKRSRLKQPITTIEGNHSKGTVRLGFRPTVSITKICNYFYKILNSNKIDNLIKESIESEKEDLMIEEGILHPTIPFYTVFSNGPETGGIIDFELKNNESFGLAFISHKTPGRADKADPTLRAFSHFKELNRLSKNIRMAYFGHSHLPSTSLIGGLHLQCGGSFEGMDYNIQFPYKTDSSYAYIAGFPPAAMGFWKNYVAKGTNGIQGFVVSEFISHQLLDRIVNEYKTSENETIKDLLIKNTLKPNELPSSVLARYKKYY